MESTDQVIAQAISALDGGDYSLALQQLSSAYQSYPDNDEILVLLCEALIETDGTKQAIEKLAQRAQKSHVPADVLFALGDAYFGINCPADALNCYQRLLKMPDASAEAWVRNGLISLSENDLVKARSCFVNALDIDADNLNALNSLGDLCLDEDDFSKARTWLQRALEIDSLDPETNSTLAEVCYAEGDLENAQKFAKQAITIDQQFAPAWLTLGYVALDGDDEDQVRRCFKQFLNLEQSDVAADIIVEVKAVLAALKD